MRDLYSNVSAVKSILPIVGNNDTEGTGTGVDLKGYESAFVVFEVGASGDTLSGTVLITLRVQESDDDSTYTDVAAADLVGGANAIVIDDPAEDDVIHVRGYNGARRYIRAFVDFTGTHTNGIPISAVVVRGNARHLGGQAA
jgi:hypothetical protein